MRSPAKAAPVALFLVIALYATHGAWRSPDLLAGGFEEPDYTGSAWFVWWVSFAVRHNLAAVWAALAGEAHLWLDPFHATWTFYPVGQAHLAQYNLLDAFVGAPFVALLGPRQGYNFLVVATMATTGWGAYLVARTAGASRWGACAAGVVLETSAFLLHELREGRVSQGLLIFWLLALDGVIRISGGDLRRRRVVGTGLLIAASALVYWYYALLLLLACAALLSPGARQRGRPVWAALAGAALIALVGVLPFVVPLMGDYGALPGVARQDLMEDFGAYSRGEVGLSMAMRHADHALWPILPGSLLPEVVQDKRVGFVVLGLGGLALALRAGQSRRWGVVALLGYLFALGPWLRLRDGTTLDVPLPFLLAYELVPYFSRLWWPQRFELLAWLGLAVLVALAIDALRRRSRSVGMAIGPLAIVLVLGEHAVRYADFPLRAGMVPFVDPLVYGGLEGGIVTVPVLGRQPQNRHALWAQMWHEQPILYGLGAHVEGHRPPGYEAYIRGNGVLLTLAGLSDGTWQGGWVDPAAVQSLLDDGFRWAVIDTVSLGPRLEAPYVQDFSMAFNTLFGPAERMGATSGAWRIQPIRGPTWVGPTSISVEAARGDQVGMGAPASP